MFLLGDFNATVANDSLSWLAINRSFGLGKMNENRTKAA